MEKNSLHNEDLVLVVEDDHAIREAIAFLLRAEGYKVETAHDGRDALKKLESGIIPCLILLDLAMPNMDGPAFIEIQRRNTSWADIPVIVLSGDGRVGDKVPTGVADVVIKPVDLEVLLEMVGMHC